MSSGMPSLAHGLSVYYKYFTKEKEEEFGVVAIRFELI
jgi:ASC-1-like (ASCH) protein